jgi:hypothetical protein
MIVVFETNPDMKEEWERTFRDSQLKKFLVFTSNFESAIQTQAKFVIIDLGNDNMIAVIEKVKISGADICLVADSYDKVKDFITDPRIASLCLKENMDQVVDWVRFMQHKSKMMDMADGGWFSKGIDKLSAKLSESTLIEGRLQ